MSISQKNRVLKLTTPPLPNKVELVVEQLSANEGLNRLFHYTLTVLAEQTGEGNTPTQVDPKDVLGKLMSVRASHRTGGFRYFNGMCVEFVQGNRDTRWTHFRAVLVPHVWLLTQKKQSRIYQQVSVPDILKDVMSGFEVDYELQGTYNERNYCVQYRETDWDFASRLMEEEGIYYYFEHKEDSHRLIIADTPQSHRPCPTEDTLPFLKTDKLGVNQEGRVLTWGVGSRLRTGKVTVWDDNFQQFGQHLEADARRHENFAFASNDKLEVYEYPGGYAARYDGIDKSGGDQAGELKNIFKDNKNTATIRQQAIDVDSRNEFGTADSCSLIAGYRFKLDTHPIAENNCYHVLVNLAVDAVQSPGYLSGEASKEPYHVSFVSIPYGSGAPPYRPPRKTEKPLVYGTQTAVVVGPSGEEIFTDKYGRVKVQFHWDRMGKADSSSSCWVRVGQAWAGNLWGTMFIPRIGMEVVVNFIDGDPDQPLITGCVYNPQSMPPYTLPDNKTRSTIKSNSSKGGQGFNEFRIEDKAGSEQIFIHAQKNEDIKVINDCKESIDNDRHLTVGNNQLEQVKSNKNLHVNGDHKEKIDGSMSIKVGSNIQEKAGQKYAMDSGTEIHLKAGMKVIIEGGTQVSLKAAGNFIDIGPAGVTISGTLVMINSGGAAGSGSGSSPDAPTDPQPSDDDNSGKVVTAAKPPTPPEKFSPVALVLKAAAESGAAFADAAG